MADRATIRELTIDDDNVDELKRLHEYTSLRFLDCVENPIYGDVGELIQMFGQDIDHFIIETRDPDCGVAYVHIYRDTDLDTDMDYAKRNSYFNDVDGKNNTITHTTVAQYNVVTTTKISYAAYIGESATDIYCRHEFTRENEQNPLK